MYANLKNEAFFCKLSFLLGYRPHITERWDLDMKRKITKEKDIIGIDILELIFVYEFGTNDVREKGQFFNYVLPVEVPGYFP